VSFDTSLSDTEILMTAQLKKEQKIRLLEPKLPLRCRMNWAAFQKLKRLSNVTLLARLMYKAVLRLHYNRKEQKKKKKNGQIARSSNPLCLLDTLEFQLMIRTFISNVMPSKVQAVSKSIPTVSA
jgi:hypothetical protein